jgi:hypothetical protein
MLPHRFHHEFVINVVKRTFDVKFQYPVVFPATTPDSSNRIQRRPGRSVA